MTTRSAAVRADGVDSHSRYLPPPSFEYWYYAQVYYSIMGVAIGISINLLGFAMLALLCGLCALRMGKHLTAILRPISAPLACGVSFVAVQTIFHGESSMAGSKDFVTWMMGLVIVQCLALRRGFLHRFAIVALLIGLSTVPFLRRVRE